MTIFQQFEQSIDRSIGRRNLGVILMGIIILLLLWLPYSPGQTNYTKLVFISAYFWAIMASSWAFLAGISGQFSFGHMAFMGIGAYVTGFLARDGISLGIFSIGPESFSSVGAILVGTIVAGFAGLIVGGLVLRLRSSYLALFTIAFSELFRIVVVTEFQFTGGMNGLPLRHLVVLEDSGVERNIGYYIMFFLLIGSLAIMYFISNSRVGLFLRAMREDEDAASALGVNVVLYKVLIFVITSLIVGLAGGIYFSNVGAERITPEALEILQMALVISFAVIGGMESLLGAAAGAFILRYLMEALREITIPTGGEPIIFEPGAWRYAIFGIIMVFTLRFARNGLLYPILQWFSGRSAIERETVSKRDAGEDDDIEELEASS